MEGTVYLLLDISASMSSYGKLEQLQRGSLHFFGEAWQRNYAVGAIAFGGDVSCLFGATRNFYYFQRRIRGLYANGRTAMHRAIELATYRLRSCQGYRAMILITDGQPDVPEATLEAGRMAQSLGIELITVGTHGADEAFLLRLVPKPELASMVGVEGLEQGIVQTLKSLPNAAISPPVTL
ncbi:MAG: vWA domain-containing protein [Trueperaceae bacterium]